MPESMIRFQLKGRTSFDLGAAHDTELRVQFFEIGCGLGVGLAGAAEEAWLCSLQLWMTQQEACEFAAGKTADSGYGDARRAGCELARHCDRRRSPWGSILMRLQISQGILQSALSINWPAFRRDR